jgi:hypothetical protein
MVFKLTKPQRKQLRKSRQPVDHHKEGIMERGAAKILGFVSGHIYASKPE